MQKIGIVICSRDIEAALIKRKKDFIRKSCRLCITRFNQTGKDMQRFLEKLLWLKQRYFNSFVAQLL